MSPAGNGRMPRSIPFFKVEIFHDDPKVSPDISLMTNWRVS
jgi:hypothetical protein